MARAAENPDTNRVEGQYAGRPIQQFLTYRLSVLNARLNRQASLLLQRAGGLKIPEWRIIALLETNGEMNGRLIESVAGLDAGLVSRTFRSLDERGLIALRRSREDRRIAIAALTPAGRAVFDKVRPVMAKRQDLLLAALTPEETALVFRALDKLMLAAGDVTMDSPAP